MLPLQASGAGCSSAISISVNAKLATSSFTGADTAASSTSTALQQKYANICMPPSADWNAATLVTISQPQATGVTQASQCNSLSSNLAVGSGNVSEGRVGGGGNGGGGKSLGY